ncbi:MAG: MFS transporter [bacterium]|nr:MFS transporter [bacterium]
MTSAASPPSRPYLWYGWVVLAVVFIAITTLSAVRSSLGFFIPSLEAEFGWSRAQSSGAFSASLIGQAATAYFFGWLTEKWGVRKTMSLGVLIAGAALLIGPFIHSLFVFYLMYFFLSAGMIAATYVPQVVAISNWFVRKRGMAMGISNTSQGFAPILNLATPVLIGALGWRYSYLAMAAFVLLFTLPVTAIFQRDHPRDKGTVPDAPFLHREETPPGAGETRPAEVSSPDKRSALSLRFFYLAGTFGAVAYVFASTIVHTVPLARSYGFSAPESAVLFAIGGGFLVAGNLISGLSDRIGRGPTFITGALIGSLAACLLALFGAGAPLLQIYAGVALAGVALGMIRPTTSALLADHFSGPGFGRMNDLVNMAFSIFGAAGPFATGYLFDRTGGYRAGFLVIAGFYLLGAVFAGALSRFQTR